MKKIQNIDFTSVKRRLCLLHHQGGFAWDLKEAESAIQVYLKFLTSVATYLETQPLNKVIFSDESRRLFEQVVLESDRARAAIVWEAHILNTRQYVEDCQRIFNRYLHYAPGLIRADEEVPV